MNKKKPTILAFIRMGFEPITEWEIRNERIKPRSLAYKEHGGWVYAFAVEGLVKYVGLTNRVLRSRLSDYSYITESQPKRLRSLIRSELESGNAVLIYGKRERDESALLREEARLRVKYELEWNRI